MIRYAGLGLALVGASGLAAAAAKTSPQGTTFTVQLTITKECSITAPATLDFSTATLGPTPGPWTANTTFTVTCTNTTPYKVGMGPGTHNLSGRRMQGTTNTAAFVTYDLFTDPGHLTSWTDPLSVGGTGGASGTGNGAAQPFTVYGQVPAQTPAPDVYTDTMTVSVYF